MSETTRHQLRRVLAAGYVRFRRRLAQRLGSDSLAGDVLHETWVRLGQGGALAPVANADAYVYRVALNTAHSMRTSAARDPQPIDPATLHALADDAPGPDRTIEAQDQLRIVRAAIDELPERQRAVFLACFIHGVPSETIAARYGVSLRTVQTDLRTAVVHCARRLGRKDVFAERSFRVSRKWE